MNRLIPEFDFEQVILAPWTGDLRSTLCIVAMGFLVTLACGWVGNYLMLRRMALVGDAISHSVLPGLAVAFLITGKRSSGAMFVGALVAGIVTTILIELIHKRSRVKQDAAIGITFTSLFALGVILITLYASKVDLDQECVLYGEMGFVPFESEKGIPPSLLRMGVVALLTLGLVFAFYKELLVSSFDAGLSASLGINSTLMHYGLMCWLSVVVVSAFDSVGAILVIAMLILPGATASLLSRRLPGMLGLTALHAALSSLGGFHLATWLDCTMAGAVVMMATGLFGLTWIFAPREGLVARWIRHSPQEPPLLLPAESEPAASPGNLR